MLSILFTSQLFLQNPSCFTLNAGGNTIQILVTPIGNLNSFLNLLINGFNVKDDTRCIFPLTVTLPACTVTSSKLFTENTNSKNAASLVIAPNPAKESTTIDYISNITALTIEIYSILGNKISSYTATSTKGSWNVDTSVMPSGIYIVVLKENGLIVSQQKLSIK